MTSPILYNCENSENLRVLFSNCTVIKTVISHATPITQNKHCKQLTKLFYQPHYSIMKLNETSLTLMEIILLICHSKNDYDPKKQLQINSSKKRFNSIIIILIEFYINNVNNRLPKLLKNGKDLLNNDEGDTQLNR